MLFGATGIRSQLRYVLIIIIIITIMIIIGTIIVTVSYGDYY